MFELEFHIPYFAIRRDGNAVDNRTFEGGRLRKAVRLPLPRTELEEMSHYYEVNISLLVIGVDDWLWTSYFLVDTYHGSEPQKLKYLNDRSPREPATAGTKSLDFPLWCPREFFITVLNVRFNQAVREFRATIDAFDGRMSEYVSTIPGKLAMKTNLVHRRRTLYSASLMTEINQGLRN
jgi:hypothetical protein